MLEVFTHLADWLTYNVLGLASETKLADAVHFFIEDTSKIFALLAAMIFVIGFLRAGLDANRIRSFLSGKSRFVCYFLAATLGAVTPFCSCSVCAFNLFCSATCFSSTAFVRASSVII